MTKNDIENLNQLLSELVALTTKKFPGQIDSMVLLGSAATGEWIRGKSDIDCIVFIKDHEYVKKIEDYLLETLLILDKKYDLKLSETCTTFEYGSNIFIDQLRKTEASWWFGRPFLVISSDQIDLKKAIMKKDIKLIIGTRVIASLHAFFHRIRSTGKVIYGRDIVKEFPTDFPMIEKIKVTSNSSLLLFVSYITWAIDPKFSVQHTTKANLWACDNVLFMFERLLKNKRDTVNEITRIFKDSNLKTDCLMESLEYSNKPESVNPSRFFAIKFALKSTFFIVSMYAETLRKRFYGFKE